MTDPVPSNYSDIILRHYRAEAELHGSDTSSTMRDEVTRGREIAAIDAALQYLRTRDASISKVLEIGCGNGYLLGVLRKNFPNIHLAGLEYTPEMVEIARGRQVEDCAIQQGDVRQLSFADASFDVAITERCIINVMDREDQARSLREVARVLRPGGHFICIEAFLDGLGQLNAARDELGLPPNEPPHHNIWFDKAWFLDTIGSDFEIVDLAAAGLPPTNFLSSHYFVSRVVYPSITKRDVMYNTHFVKFLSFMPPTGNYSPIQLYVLRRR